LADDISRNHVSSLASQVPMINPSPTLIPPALWAVLVLEAPDWTSKRWRMLFGNFMLTV
jgi:hypothetical protein